MLRLALRFDLRFAVDTTCLIGGSGKGASLRSFLSSVSIYVVDTNGDAYTGAGFIVAPNVVRYLLSCGGES
jgi:hypothetical protein